MNSRSETCPSQNPNQFCAVHEFVTLAADPELRHGPRTRAPGSSPTSVASVVTKSAHPTTRNHGRSDVRSASPRCQA